MGFYCLMLSKNFKNQEVSGCAIGSFWVLLWQRSHSSFPFIFFSFSLCFCTFFFSFLRTIEHAVVVFMFCARAFCFVHFAMARSHKLCVASKRAFHKCWFIAISGRDMKINIHSYLSMVWIVLALHNRTCFGFGIVVGYETTTTTTITIWNGSYVSVHFGCRFYSSSSSHSQHIDIQKKTKPVCLALEISKISITESVICNEMYSITC